MTAGEIATVVAAIGAAGKYPAAREFAPAVVAFRGTEPGREKALYAPFFASKVALGGICR